MSKQFAYINRYWYVAKKVYEPIEIKFMQRPEIKVSICPVYT